MHASAAHDIATWSFATTELRQCALCVYPCVCLCVCVCVCVCVFTAVSGLEDPRIGEEDELATHMGLFLQKTNIIRDYLVSGTHTDTQARACTHSFV